MKFPAALAALILVAGCATTLTPQRCGEAAAGLATAAQIAQLLIDSGVAPARAGKLAAAVTTGRMLLTAACAEVTGPGRG